MKGPGALEWLFRNRETGELTIAQRPNGPLLVVLAAWALRWVLDPSGAVDTVLAVTAGVALVIWALDELIRGVNPWRRLLGGAVLAGQLLGLALA